jgi:hypothetical protein
MPRTRVGHGASSFCMVTPGLEQWERTPRTGASTASHVTTPVSEIVIEAGELPLKFSTMRDKRFESQHPSKRS